MFSRAGKIGPGYCTGVGKAMLAFLSGPQKRQAIAQQAFNAFTKNTLTTPHALDAELAIIRKCGIAFDREEHESHIICVAAPVLHSAGRVIGGLSVTSSTQRHSLSDLERFKPDLLKTVAKIGREAENWHFPDLKN
jgi:DNA-binding IclR family transcriptional regulator